MNRIKWFLDSGAFSAFTQGAEIDIQEYIEFIKEHKDYLEAYANLDVIGDAEAPNIIAQAVFSGHLAAREFEENIVGDTPFKIERINI